MVRDNTPYKRQMNRDKGINMTDLDLTAVLRKTESGIDAIKLRDRALTPKQRMLLIMVDGTKTVADLVKPMTSPEEGLQLLGELLTSGHVCKPEVPKVLAKPAPVLARVSSQALLSAAIQRTTRLLENLLGPTCEPLCLQLEKCKNMDEFAAKVQDLRRIVAAMRSEKKADEFLSAALNA